MQASEAIVRDLDLDERDRKFGIVHVVAVTFERIALVVVEGSDGMVAAGRHAPWPGQPFIAERSIAKARFRARGKLAKARHNRRRVYEREAAAAMAEAAE